MWKQGIVLKQVTDLAVPGRGIDACAGIEDHIAVDPDIPFIRGEHACYGTEGEGFPEPDGPNSTRARSVDENCERRRNSSPPLHMRLVISSSNFMNV